MLVNYAEMQKCLSHDKITEVMNKLSATPRDVLTEDDVKVMYTTLYLTREELINDDGTDFANIQKEAYGSRYEVSTEVLNFIAGVLYHRSWGFEARRALFRAGYCLHFAQMLERVFGRGRVMIAYPIGHCVWEDSNGVTYDIEGVFDPKEHDVIDMVPFDDCPARLTNGFWHADNYPVYFIGQGARDELSAWFDEWERRRKL